MNINAINRIDLSLIMGGSSRCENKMNGWLEYYRRTSSVVSAKKARAELKLSTMLEF